MFNDEEKDEGIENIDEEIEAFSDELVIRVKKMTKTIYEKKRADGIRRRQGEVDELKGAIESMKKYKERARRIEDGKKKRKKDNVIQ